METMSGTVARLFSHHGEDRAVVPSSLSSPGLSGHRKTGKRFHAGASPNMTRADHSVANVVSPLGGVSSTQGC